MLHYRCTSCTKVLGSLREMYRFGGTAGIRESTQSFICLNNSFYSSGTEHQDYRTYVNMITRKCLEIRKIQIQNTKSLSVFIPLYLPVTAFFIWWFCMEYIQARHLHEGTQIKKIIIDWIFSRTFLRDGDDGYKQKCQWCHAWQKHVSLPQWLVKHLICALILCGQFGKTGSDNKAPASCPHYDSVILRTHHKRWIKDVTDA